ncbi:3-keto-5-aminohexanoate cleavage protein (plasmid) [Rhizobium sp. CB3060]|uniref:3-keto-5-aminohexanoate cleavage protein n=1 Tax=Rhizobium sp. CB3060 TaxID=3138255 RepID=UPI0021A6A634|nr:3-keto-5-aminohexanoate cleavage protein [Rhizobium tropici]UWU25419.1 3-keto-5-aminohexanoate cleavage protein [Rhizobium tropici]
MGLNPSRDVFITCAVTGAGDTPGRSEKVPVTPRQIADASIEAANAGAAIVHIHVRNPETGKGARDAHLYEEVLNLIKRSGVDVVINFTAGMGGALTFGPAEQPMPLAAVGTDIAGATERLVHVKTLLPEICTLDCGTMNFGDENFVLANTPAMLKEMAAQVLEYGVKPEIEIFDTGHLLLAKWLHEQGLLSDPVMVQLCMGIRWCAPDDLTTLNALISRLPEDWTFSAFSIGRNQLPYTALALAAGGHIRVGLEDNLWLDKGVLATNGALVARAVVIAEAMGSRIMSAKDVRKKLNLQRRW